MGSIYIITLARGTLILAYLIKAYDCVWMVTYAIISYACNTSLYAIIASNYAWRPSYDYMIMSLSMMVYSSIITCYLMRVSTIASNSGSPMPPSNGDESTPPIAPACPTRLVPMVMVALLALLLLELAWLLLLLVQQLLLLVVVPIAPHQSPPTLSMKPTMLQIKLSSLHHPLLWL